MSTNLNNTVPAALSGYTNVSFQTDGSGNVSACVPASTPNPMSPDTYPSPENAANDEFDGSVLDTAGTRFAGATPWAWVNQGSASATLINGYLNLYEPNDTSAGVRGISQPIASGSAWKYRIKLRGFRGDTSEFLVTGMFLTDGTKCQAWSRFCDGSDNKYLKVGNYNNVSGSYAGDAYTVGSPYSTLNDPNELPFMYFEIELAGGNLYFRYSLDGTVFVQSYTCAVGSWLSTITQIGLNITCVSGSTGITSIVDWFRRIS